MQFNSQAQNQDCVSEVLKICGATLNTYGINDITRRFNAAVDRYFGIAFEADSRWSLDDLNQTSPPLESITLTSGIQKYALDTFTSEIINVLRIEALDANSNPIILKPVDEKQIRDQALTAFMNVSGTPQFYRKFAKWLYLYPAPNYTLASALSAYFERPATRMLYTDTTKVPGVPSIHHPYLCRMTALPYLIEKKLPQLAGVMKQIGSANREDRYYGGDELAISTHFSRRDKDTVQQITTRRRSSR